MTLLTFLANHVWQSPWFALIVLVANWLLRRYPAETRYRLWLVASLKFLIPFSVLFTVGRQFEWRAASAAVPQMPPTIALLGQPFVAPELQIPLATVSMRPSLVDVALAIWLGGFLFLVFRRWQQWREIARALRLSSPVALIAPVEVRTSPVPLEPGIFGILRPVLLLPQGILERLTPAQFQSLLAHEFCHARRHDNLTAALHMAVEAVFWFHPLVWWIGGQLIQEREQACDDEVVRLGSRPDVYAQAILNVCRFYVESPLACAAGVTGADLKARIKAIMSNRSCRRLTLFNKAILATAAMLAVSIPVALGVAQSPAVLLRFEVASIKQANSEGTRGGLVAPPGGGLRMSGTTLRDLITLAYGLPDSRVMGGPRWIGSVTWSINARPDPPDGIGGRPPAPDGWSRLQLRLQNLLTERFHLVVRRESKQGPIYVLSLAGGGPKLTPTVVADDVPSGTNRSRDQINSRAGTMQMLSGVLTNMLGRPVEDRTGLTGRYDYKLQYAPEAGFGNAGSGEASAAATSPEGPSVFRALEEQLGLKLESARGSIESLVIVSAEKATEN